jgi:hypothetical protein
MTFIVFRSPILRRIFKILAWSIGGMALLSILLSLVLLIPSVQTHVTSRVTKALSKQTGVEIKVKEVHIAFPKTVRINGIFIEDAQQDTLLFCEELDVNVALFPLLKKKVDIAELRITNFKGIGYRNAKDTAFNFSSILQSFSGNQTEETSEPSNWSLGFEKIVLTDIKLNYDDHLDSVFLHLNLGKLLVDANDTDLLKLYFDIEEIALSETHLHMALPQELSKQSDTTEHEPIPLNLSLEILKAANISYELTIGDADLAVSALVKDATIRPEMFDFNASTIVIDELKADGITTRFGMIPSDTAIMESDRPPEPVSDHTFGNFEWDFLVKRADIKNTNYKMALDDAPGAASGMDYLHMELTDFNVSADSIFFNKDGTGAHVQSLSVRESSGPEVQQLAGEFLLNNQNFLAKKLVFKTNRSSAKGQISLSYPSFNLIGEKISQLGINTNLSGEVHRDDILPFTRIIDEYPALQKVISVKINAFQTSGIVGDLALKRMDLSFNNGTFLDLQANIKGLPASDLYISYTLDTLFSSREKLLQLLPDSIIPNGLQLPQNLGISSKGNTDLKNGNLALDLASDYGSANANVMLKDNLLDLDLQLSKIDLGSILSDTTLGSISLVNHTEGVLLNFTPERFESKTVLQSAQLNQHTFENAKIDVGYEDDTYNVHLELNDSSLTTVASGKYFLEDSIHHLMANIEISTLELSGLNLLDEYFMASGDINIDLRAKSENEVNGDIDLSKIRLSRPNNHYFIEHVNFSADMKESSNDFYLQSDILDAAITGNTRLSELDSAIVDHLDHFIHLPEYMISEKDFYFDFNLALKKSDFFTDFLLDGLQEFQLEKCELHYNDKDDILTAEIHIPRLQYGGIQLSDLNLDFDTKADSAIADMQLSELSYNSISIDKIGFRSLFEMDHAKMIFYSRDEFDSLKYQLIYNILLKDSLYHISIEPDQVVLNYENWQIADDNLLVAGDTVFYTNSATISKDDQSVSLRNKKKKMFLEFKNFSLENLTGIATRDTSIEQLSGAIQGSIAFSDIFKNPEMIADLKINELASGDALLGTIETKLEYQADQPLSFDFGLNNTTNSLRAKGLLPTSEQQDLQVILDINLDDLHVFEPVFSNYARNMQGAITGKMVLEGKTTDPRFNGKFHMQSFDFTVIKTNTRLNSTGGINISNNLISFTDFTIKDSLQNKLDIKGQIDFSKFSDPLFAMEVSTNDFLLINKKMEQKDVIEGKLNLGLQLRVDGRKSKLKVRNDITINESTNVAYMMPGNDLELITDEGIVKYIDFDQAEPDTVLVQKQKFIGDSIVSLVKGIDFETTLSINKKAKFTVVVDPKSGDFSEFRLTGRLQYLYNDKQKGKLNGLVEFTEGFYELSFYGLVKKRFIFEPGSIVSWSGEVMGGDLNFSARHTVRTNSIGLVSNEISSYERSRYNQRLPYDVILKISDKISSPSIGFGIDLPERYRSTYPTLDSKLSSLNQPSMESERNKQVFALLVGGTFIPEDPSITESSGGSNFATTAAMNSVNSIMTQQLNKLTGQIIKGFDVDMGVNTFDDFGTGHAQTKTQLDVKVSKNLFNDRVTAEMESHINLDGSGKEVGQQSTAGMTEFAVSYKLTETGNYRIKAFRENAYDIFDGEIQNSGIAFIFIKEFDSISKSKNEGAKNRQDKQQENNTEQQKN